MMLLLELCAIYVADFIVATVEELKDAVGVLFMMFVSWMLQIAARIFNAGFAFSSPWQMRFGRNLVWCEDMSMTRCSR